MTACAERSRRTPSSAHGIRSVSAAIAASTSGVATYAREQLNQAEDRVLGLLAFAGLPGRFSLAAHVISVRSLPEDGCFPGGCDGNARVAAHACAGARARLLSCACSRIGVQVHRLDGQGSAPRAARVCPGGRIPLEKALRPSSSSVFAACTPVRVHARVLGCARALLHARVHASA